MIKFTIIVFGLLNIIYNVYSYKPRVYMRIPHHFVNDRVIQFLNTNRINNCFEFEESPTNLLLKCWRENQLVNVNINIDKEYQQRYFPQSLSI
jgi:hypothetical protein